LIAHPLTIDGRRSVQPITINGSLPAPLIRLREGREAVLRVTNKLDEYTSIHWHGILLPFEMDGVPGVSFPGIAPGETFEYRYPVRQSGTYWYHSHSGLQEQLGHYGALVVDPAEPEPFEYDREYVIVLSDWTFSDPSEVMRNLKVAEGITTTTSGRCPISSGMWPTSAGVPPGRRPACGAACA